MKAARERAGWSVEALAYHSGLSWSAVSQLESGRRKNPRPATLAALAEALGVTIEYLVGGGSRQPRMLNHHALVYAGDEGFLEVVGPFLAAAGERSEAALAVTTEPNIRLLRQRARWSLDHIEFVDSESWYDSPVSALEAYRSFVVDSTSNGASWVRVVGEPLWAGRTGEETRMWTQYESMINLTFALLPLTLLCTYDERTVEREISDAARLTHPYMLEAGEVVGNDSYLDPAAFVLGPEDVQ